MNAQIDVAAPAKLTILYDETCRLCRRARDWLLTQPCLVEVELLPAGSVEARRYADIPWTGTDLVVVDDHGNVWAGPSAFLACMWATAKYRRWAFRLARPSLAPHAERFFRWVSSRRDRLGRWMDDDEDCTWCQNEPPPPPRAVRCGNGHEMPPEAHYCRACGLARPTVT